MLSKYDAWLTTPPESNVPEMDQADEERLLLDILWSSFRKSAAHNVPADSVRHWLKTEILDDDAIFEALSDYHKAEIEKRWEAEHSDPLDDGDAAYEARRERDWDRH